MKGKWVWALNLLGGNKGVQLWAVNIIHGRQQEGTNSVFSDYGMAVLKRNRMQSTLDKVNPGARAILRRVMYFKDAVKEDSFEDYCSICGGHLKTDQPLSETYKSSIERDKEKNEGKNGTDQEIPH